MYLSILLYTCFVIRAVCFTIRNGFIFGRLQRRSAFCAEHISPHTHTHMCHNLNKKNPILFELHVLAHANNLNLSSIFDVSGIKKPQSHVVSSDCLMFASRQQVCANTRAYNKFNFIDRNFRIVVVHACVC